MINIWLLLYFQSTLACAPKDGDCGGIPAGCQCDLDNNIWIADMRLGILKMDTSGNYEQVCLKFCHFFLFFLFVKILIHYMFACWVIFICVCCPQLTFFKINFIK